jgi:ABC-type glycerol-3-phosphate transport system substrate-binding protein
MSEISRRRVVTWPLLGGAAALLAACGAPAAAPTAAPAKPTEAAKPAAAPGATTAPAAVPTAAPAAAAKPATSKAPVTLRLHMRSGGEKSEPAIYVERPGEWEQETGHKVVLEPTPGGKDYTPKMMALAAGNTMGDTLFTSDAWSEHTFMVRNGLIEPVDDYLSRYNVKKTEWVKPIIDALTHEGKMYGLPKTGHPSDAFIIVNLKMFDEAGIKRPETYGTTFEHLREWAVKLTKGPRERRDAYGYYVAVNGNLPMTNNIRQWGGDLIDKEGVTSLVDQEPFWNWLQWTSDLIVKEAVHPLGAVVPAGDANALAGMFVAGKLAMVHAARYMIFPFRTAIANSFDWTVIQHPRGPQAKGWNATIDTHSVAVASKHKEEAFSLIYALADRRFAYLVAKTQGYLTGRVDNLEAIKELADDHFIKLQQKCTEQEDAPWRAKNLRSYEIQDELTNKLDLVWLGKTPADKAFVADLKKGLDAVLAKPGL